MASKRRKWRSNAHRGYQAGAEFWNCRQWRDSRRSDYQYRYDRHLPERLLDEAHQKAMAGPAPPPVAKSDEIVAEWRMFYGVST